MRKGKIETPLSRLSERSPRGSVLEKPMLINQGKLTSFPKPQYNTIEEELSHLPYKENVNSVSIYIFIISFRKFKLLQSKLVLIMKQKKINIYGSLCKYKL